MSEWGGRAEGGRGSDATSIRTSGGGRAGRPGQGECTASSPGQPAEGAPAPTRPGTEGKTGAGTPAPLNAGFRWWEIQGQRQEEPEGA